MGNSVGQDFAIQAQQRALRLILRRRGDIALGRQVR